MIRHADGKTSARVIPIEKWNPDLPHGPIESVYLHWSGGDYATVFPSYHFCVALESGRIVVAQTHDLRANMRDVSSAGEYAAHTYQRNSFAAGLAFMGMKDATPSNFGAYPLTEALVDGLCRVAAVIVRFYGIEIDPQHILTHAEAAVIDGYFGAAEDERWDIARLSPASHALEPRDALKTGEELRRRIRLHLSR